MVYRVRMLHGYARFPQSIACRFAHIWAEAKDIIGEAPYGNFGNVGNVTLLIVRMPYERSYQRCSQYSTVVSIVFGGVNTGGTGACCQHGIMPVPGSTDRYQHVVNSPDA